MLSSWYRHFTTDHNDQDFEQNQNLEDNERLKDSRNKMDLNQFQESLKKQEHNQRQIKIKKFIQMSKRIHQIQCSTKNKSKTDEGTVCALSSDFRLWVTAAHVLIPNGKMNMSQKYENIRIKISLNQKISQSQIQLQVFPDEVYFSRNQQNFATMISNEYYNKDIAIIQLKINPQKDQENWKDNKYIERNRQIQKIHESLNIGGDPILGLVDNKKLQSSIYYIIACDSQKKKKCFNYGQCEPPQNEIIRYTIDTFSSWSGAFVFTYSQQLRQFIIVGIHNKMIKVNEQHNKKTLSKGVHLTVPVRNTFLCSRLSPQYRTLKNIYIAGSKKINPFISLMQQCKFKNIMIASKFQYQNHHYQNYESTITNHFKKGCLTMQEGQNTGFYLRDLDGVKQWEWNRTYAYQCGYKKQLLRGYKVLINIILFKTNSKRIFCCERCYYDGRTLCKEILQKDRPPNQQQKKILQFYESSYTKVADCFKQKYEVFLGIWFSIYILALIINKIATNYSAEYSQLSQPQLVFNKLFQFCFIIFCIKSIYLCLGLFRWGYQICWKMIKSWKFNDLKIVEINQQELRYLQEMRENLRQIFQKSITRIPSIISSIILQKYLWKQIRKGIYKLKNKTETYEEKRIRQKRYQQIKIKQWNDYKKPIFYFIKYLSLFEIIIYFAVWSVASKIIVRNINFKSDL